MAPKGGYKKNTDPRGEYVRLDQIHDAEAKLCAAKMGMTFEVWIADAVEHHLYRCERFEVQARYQADIAAFNADPRAVGSPLQSDPKYRMQRPEPTISWPGQGRGPIGNAPKPRA